MNEENNMRRLTVVALALICSIAIVGTVYAMQWHGCSEGDYCTGFLGCLSDNEPWFDNCFMWCDLNGYPWSAGQCDFIF